MLLNLAHDLHQTIMFLIVLIPLILTAHTMHLITQYRSRTAYKRMPAPTLSDAE